MKVRRLLALLLALTLVLPASALAQPQVFPLSFGNQIYSFVASQGVVNTTTSALIFTAILPPALFATPPSANIIVLGGGTAGVSGIANTGVALSTMGSSTVAGMPIPVHVSIKGSITYASGTINMGANWGKGTNNATVALVWGATTTTAWTPVAAQGNQTTNAGPANPWAPLNIDCWAIPVATASGVLNSLPAGILSCRTEIASLGAPSATPAYTNYVTSFLTAGSTTTAFQVASPQVLNIRFQWGTAAPGNALMIHSATVTLGW